MVHPAGELFPLVEREEGKKYRMAYCPEMRAMCSMEKGLFVMHFIYKIAEVSSKGQRIMIINDGWKRGGKTQGKVDERCLGVYAIDLIGRFCGSWLDCMPVKQAAQL